MRTGSAYAEELNELLCAAKAFDGASVLITGAAGAIGRALTDTLAWRNKNGGSIRILAAGRDTARLEQLFNRDDDVEAVKYDAAKPFSPCFRADYIVHAACSAHPRSYASDPVGVMQANLLGTYSLLECARSWNAKLLFLSSGEIYGENPVFEKGFSETDTGVTNTMLPRSCYPESKRAAETLCAAYAAQYGVCAIVARLSHTYGATVSSSNSRADAQFLYKALAGEDIVLKSRGESVRSFTYMADCVSAIMFLLANGIAGEAYNVSNPDSVASIREYAQMLADIAGIKLRFDLPDTLESAGYTKITRAVLSSEKLRSLGWMPRFSLREGLERTFKIAGEISSMKGIKE